MDEPLKIWSTFWDIKILTLDFMVFCSITCLLSVDERILVMEMESNIAEIAGRSEFNGLYDHHEPREMCPRIPVS